VSRRETNARLRDPITVRSTSSGLLIVIITPFGFFRIISSPFPVIKLSPFLFDYLPSAYLFSAQL